MSFISIYSVCIFYCYLLLHFTGNTIEVNCFPTSSSIPTKVLVTGAEKPFSVGYFVFKKLLEKKSFYPIALLENEASKKHLLKLGATDDQLRIGDIRKKDSIKGKFKDAKKAILCSSSVPCKKFGFHLRNLFRTITFRKKLTADIGDLYYPKDRTPYLIDYIGQRHVIDEMMKEGAEHIILLGNMGGYRGSKVNNIGRDSSNKDQKLGNVLKWKRAAERYLMKRCFFTIIHAGTLTDDPGGQREVIWDVDDALLRTNLRKIPKEDAAEVLIQALLWKEAIGRSIDVATRPIIESKATIDWLRFWSMPGNCLYPADLDNLDD